METPKYYLPDAHFGTVQDDDQQEAELPEIDDSDDDEELESTPEDVVDLLGFDPLELDE